MKILKKAIIFVCAAAMAVSIGGCQSRTTINTDKIPESTGGKDVVRAEAADNVFSLNSNSKYSFNPIIATNHANQLVCALVYENMVEVDNNFEVIPNIISEWECTEDGCIWTMYLDKENPHYFSDGTQVTGRDLRYSLERAVFADRFTGRFSSFQGVSFWEDKIQVTLGIGDKQFIKLLNIPVIKNGTYDSKEGSRPIGSGPYAYNEDFTELHPNEHYPNRDGLPLDVIYIKEYPTAADIISAFEDSYIDLVINDPSSYTNLGYASTNEIHNYATTNMHYVAFNVNGKMGKDSSFRYAMNFAFDRAYLEELLNGDAVASSVAMYPTCTAYPETLAEQLSYNLELCKVVLANAGVRDYDDDGRLEYLDASNEPEIVFVVCSDSSAKTGVARRFAADMAEIGLKVDVQEVTWKRYIEILQGSEQLDNKGDPKEEYEFDMYYGEVKLRNNFDITELLEERTENNRSSNVNYTRSKDETCMQLIKNYLAASDAGRAEAYYELCQYVSTQAIIIPIGFEKQQMITHRGVIRGMDPNIGNPLYNFENWIIEMD